MNNSKVIWGLVLVVFGALFLLNNFNILPWNFWFRLSRLWPVLLILVGIAMLVRDRRLALALAIGVVVLALAWAIWGYEPPMRYWPGRGPWSQVPGHGGLAACWM